MKQGFRGNCDSQGKLGMCPSLAEPDSSGISRSEVSNYEPQANKKFFDPTIFQKCWRGVGEQPTFAKQIKLHNERKQKSKRKSKESQLPSKMKGCNERQGFRGNCDSQGKLGMCPSLAEPDSGGIPRTSRRQTKVFRCSSFSKMLPRCGRAAHVCEANQTVP